MPQPHDNPTSPTPYLKLPLHLILQLLPQIIQVLHKGVRGLQKLLDIQVQQPHSPHNLLEQHPHPLLVHSGCPLVNALDLVVLVGSEKNAMGADVLVVLFAPELFGFVVVGAFLSGVCGGG